MALKGLVVKQNELEAECIEQMFRLKTRYYEQCERTVFLADLKEKDWVILVKNDEDVVGFSTAKLFSYTVEGRLVYGFFSGDTIIDQNITWEVTFHRTCVQLVKGLMEQVGGSIYWFMISKGYKTYRYLPTYFKTFYPHPQLETPAFEQLVMDTYAREKYGTYYVPETGVIYNSGWNDYLKPDVAPITAERLKDPFVQYFAQKNPGHIKGDELVCLALITPENMQPAFKRMLRQADAGAL